MSIWLSILALVLSVAAATFCTLTYLRDRRADKEEKKERALVAGIFAEQREEIAMLDARNARLHEDAKRMRDRLPQLWTCPVPGHAKVDWRGNVGHCMTCGRISTDTDEASGEGICGDDAVPIPGITAKGAICVLPHGHASEWHEAEPTSPGLPPMRWKNYAEPAVDEDVARPYIPTYETQQLLEQYGPKAIWPETAYDATYGPAPEVGKDEQR